MTAPAAGTDGAAQGDPAGADPNGEPNGDAAPQGDAPLGEAGLKALQAERDARAAAEARVKEFEQAEETAKRAKLSADERAKLEHDEANQRATTAEQRLARLEVAIEKKLPTELVDRLTGTTREELAADADKLLALVATLTGQPGANAGDLPRPLLPSGGGDPTVPPAETDGHKIAATIPRRY